MILFVFLLIAMRLMGKRQLGELQPFEFAITLVAAELACIPMADNNIPLVYGIIPIYTLVILHNLITQIAVKSTRFRKALNGKPVILIAHGKIDFKLLKQCNMNANDLLEGIRGEGYFSLDEIEYAILETNGRLSIMPKSSVKPATPADFNKECEQSYLPYNIIVEGKFMGETLTRLQSAPSKQEIYEILENVNLKQKDVFIFAISGDDIYIQSYNGDIINTKLKEQQK